MATFDLVPGDPSSSVILHVPHSATHIPHDVRAQIMLDDTDLSAELAAITDADTHLVAVGATARASVRPWLFINRTSRLVVDPERFPDEREELNARGMGAVYEKTTDQHTLRTPTPAQRVRRCSPSHPPVTSTRTHRSPVATCRLPTTARSGRCRR